MSVINTMLQDLDKRKQELLAALGGTQDGDIR